jgi:hypothetical protein
MGERIWTTLDIGGRITQPILDQLITLMEDHFEEDCDVEFTLQQKTCLSYTGSQNYGEVEDEVLDFLTENGLTWRTHWDGVGGVCDAGYKAWRPGLEYPVGGACDTDGDLIVTLADLIAMADEGHSLTAVIHVLKEDDVEVPPIQLVEP